MTGDHLKPDWALFYVVVCPDDSVSLWPGVIEIKDKRGTSRNVMPLTATNIFLAVSMILFSYTDKLYIEFMGYPLEIH